MQLVMDNMGNHHKADFSDLEVRKMKVKHTVAIIRNAATGNLFILRGGTE